MDNQERLNKVIVDYNPSVAERVIYQAGLEEEYYSQKDGQVQRPQDGVIL